ncbi:hypothetical protein NPIL_118531 [Nephila pilipes]|uniref:Uncharacterized protein n=1 Tax=Nephila pilipes TaxID=299642 RepID=A0A8X6Q543_NEPPI|nr:hypothetical protein NPIL_195701 [Nephila pilipes]GFU06129.1 hypothetical protein NPIL_118531 [Nephila pilipes]
MLELKSGQHLALPGVGQGFRTASAGDCSVVLGNQSQSSNVQEILDQKVEKMLNSFQTALRRQKAFLVEVFRKSLEALFVHLGNILEFGTRSTSSIGKK